MVSGGPGRSFRNSQHAVRITVLGLTGITVRGGETVPGARKKKNDDHVAAIVSFSRRTNVVTSLPSQKITPISADAGYKHAHSGAGGKRETAPFKAVWEYEGLSNPQDAVVSLTTRLFSSSQISNAEHDPEGFSESSPASHSKTFDVTIGLVRGRDTVVLGTSELDIEGSGTSQTVDLQVRPLHTSSEANIDRAPEGNATTSQRSKKKKWFKFKTFTKKESLQPTKMDVGMFPGDERVYGIAAGAFLRIHVEVAPIQGDEAWDGFDVEEENFAPDRRDDGRTEMLSGYLNPEERQPPATRDSHYNVDPGIDFSLPSPAPLSLALAGVGNGDALDRSISPPLSDLGFVADDNYTVANTVSGSTVASCRKRLYKLDNKAYNQGMEEDASKAPNRSLAGTLVSKRSAVASSRTNLHNSERLFNQQTHVAETPATGSSFRSPMPLLTILEDQNSGIGGTVKSEVPAQSAIANSEAEAQSSKNDGATDDGSEPNSEDRAQGDKESAASTRDTEEESTLYTYDDETVGTSTLASIEGSKQSLERRGFNVKEDQLKRDRYNGGGKRNKGRDKRNQSYDTESSGGTSYDENGCLCCAW